MDRHRRRVFARLFCPTPLDLPVRFVRVTGGLVTLKTAKKVARLALTMTATVAAFPQAPPTVKTGLANRLTIEDVLRWRPASNPALSPDRRRVAFIVKENDLEKSRARAQLWWVDTETRQTRHLTPGDAEVSQPRWSPDGRWLAFLSAHELPVETTAEGARESRAQVWLLPTDGGEAFPLITSPAGVLHYRWAPDGKAIYSVSREPLPKPAAALREQLQRQGSDAVIVDEERPRHEIWRTTIEDRTSTRIFAGDPGLEEFELSPDGKWIVYRTNTTGDPDHTRKFDLWLLDPRTGKPRRLTRRDGEERSPVWSPDSTRVAFLAPRVPGISYSQDEVFVVPIAAQGEPPEPQQVTKNFAGAIERLHWPAKGDGIYFAAGVCAGNRLFKLNPADGDARPLSPESWFVTQPDWSSDVGVYAAVGEGPGALPDIIFSGVPSAGSEPQVLTNLNPQLRNFALGAQEMVRWKSKDGLEIEGLLVKPPDWEPTQKYPLLVDIHGGPHDRRANTLTSGNEPQVWAGRGWLVFEPNFRGSSAYGHEFGIANRGDVGGGDFEDILAGVDFLIAQGWADPNRMAVMGGSYGGYLTNWIISRTNRFRAAVSMFGIFNLITDYSNSIYPSWEPDYLQHFYWEDLQVYLDRSPFKNVAQISTPVLILHGEMDPNTNLANSREMYQALKALGRPVKFVRFPREGHGIREPNHKIVAFRHIAAWLDQYAGGPLEVRPRSVGEAVRQGAWELKVARVRTPESYAGVKPQGRFVEAEVMIRAMAPTEERFSLLIFDTQGSEVMLASAGRSIYPVGLVAESLGERMLAKSSGQVVAIAPDKNGNHTAMAVAIAFDAPADAREFTLKVKDFPPVRFELPIEPKAAQ